MLDTSKFFKAFSILVIFILFFNVIAFFNTIPFFNIKLFLDQAPTDKNTLTKFIENLLLFLGISTFFYILLPNTRLQNKNYKMLTTSKFSKGLLTLLKYLSFFDIILFLDQAPTDADADILTKFIRELVTLLPTITLVLYVILLNNRFINSVILALLFTICCILNCPSTLCYLVMFLLSCISMVNTQDSGQN